MVLEGTLNAAKEEKQSSVQLQTLQSILMAYQQVVPASTIMEQSSWD